MVMTVVSVRVSCIDRMKPPPPPGAATYIIMTISRVVPIYHIYDGVIYSYLAGRRHQAVLHGSRGHIRYILIIR